MEPKSRGQASFLGEGWPVPGGSLGCYAACGRGLWGSGCVLQTGSGSHEASVFISRGSLTGRLGPRLRISTYSCPEAWMGCASRGGVGRAEPPTAPGEAPSWPVCQPAVWPALPPPPYGSWGLWEVCPAQQLGCFLRCLRPASGCPAPSPRQPHARFLAGSSAASSPQVLATHGTTWPEFPACGFHGVSGAAVVGV